MAHELFYGNPFQLCLYDGPCIRERYRVYAV